MLNLLQDVIKGSFWVLLERLSTQMVSFVAAMIFAWLLMLSDYGMVVLLTIFNYAIKGSLLQE